MFMLLFVTAGLLSQSCGRKSCEEGSGPGGILLDIEMPLHPSVTSAINITLFLDAIPL